MRYLLDTCVVSDFVRGDPPTRERLTALRPDQIVLSSVSLMEVEYGLAIDPQRARRIGPPLRALIESVELVPYAEPEAKATAALRAALRSRGTPIGPYDVQIPGTALARGLVLVSSNTREFARVQGLLVEDWREP
ncbi:MAG TPA: PIN domain-containing protein [Xanthomonadaceae bacterium]|nr:PIN domain-containing protein [Xanthomonadaceae bacterium]